MAPDPSFLALDTETTSLDPMRAELIGMSLAVAPGGRGTSRSRHVAPDGELAGGRAPRNLPPLTSEPLAPLRELLSDPRVPKAGHNIKYDWLVLRRAGVELAGVSFDSMLASFRARSRATLARPRRPGARATVPRGADLRGARGPGKGGASFAAVPLADAARYCATDSEIVLRLHAAFLPELEDHQLVRLLETIEMPLMPVLVDMESRGYASTWRDWGRSSRTFAAS